MAATRLPVAAADDAPTPAPAPAPVVSRGATKVIVLGSLGGQQMNPVVGAGLRCGTSVLIDVGGDVTVLDCGCGSVHRIVQAGYDLAAVRRVLITHCHFDHVSDLGSVASYGWTSGRGSGERRMDIYGPTGITAYQRGFARSVGLSIADQQGPLAQVPTFAQFARWHQFAPPARTTGILDADTLEVRAIRVQHGAIPAVGYRVKTPDVDIAFSGDRGPRGDAFPAFAKGADVLFHEIVDLDVVLPALAAQHAAKDFVSHMVSDHCDPATVGQVATAAGVGTLVLYHIIPGSPVVTDEAWAGLIAPHYAGRVIVSKDLMVV
jgi:ribonuclease BN (tRNA processing enzyme)